MNRPTMEDAIAVGDGTLHGAIDHWQEEAARWKSEATRMRHRIECLRGGLKSAAGWLLDVGDLDGHEKCLEMAGDMEPSLMGSNVKVTGAPPTDASKGDDV